MQPEEGTEDEVYAFTTDQHEMDYYPEKNMLLLVSGVEDSKFTSDMEFTVFDLSKRKEISHYSMEKLPFEYYPSYEFVSTSNPRYSGITAQWSFWIFDWKTFRAKNYGDDLTNVIWSPMCEGFLYSKDYDNKELLFVKP